MGSPKENVAQTRCGRSKEPATDHHIANDRKVRKCVLNDSRIPAAHTAAYWLRANLLPRCQLRTTEENLVPWQLQHLLITCWARGSPQSVSSPLSPVTRGSGGAGRLWPCCLSSSRAGRPGTPSYSLLVPNPSKQWAAVERNSWGSRGPWGWQVGTGCCLLLPAAQNAFQSI